MPEAPVELNVDGRSVRISSPSKPYFAGLGLNKLQVAEYFLGVGPGILAALKDRPTTMERWPGGVVEGSSLVSPSNPDGDAFYQKRAPKGTPDWVQTATVRFPSGRPAVQVCPDDDSSCEGH